MRQRAADDFDFINKRLLELQGKKQEQTEPSVTKPYIEGLTSIRQFLAGGPLSKDERFAVAKMFNCQWRNAADQGCGRNSSKSCLIQGRCTSIDPNP